MIFICYSHEDKAWVLELGRALRDRALHDVWIDERRVSGPDWWATILHNVETCDCFVYIMTAASVSSMYCRAQLSYALALGKPILPFILKLCTYPPELRQFEIYRAGQRGNMSDVLLVIEQNLHNLDSENANAHKTPKVQAPAEPMPARIGDQLTETLALAEEAAAIHNLSLAERLFYHVIQADPDGQGQIASVRMTELRSDEDRKREYRRILQMANNPAQSKAARDAWRSFAQRYPGYDPKGVARLTADTLPLTPPGDPQK